MNGERVLRYVRNRPEPEPALYDPIEIIVRDWVVQQKYLNQIQDLIVGGMMRASSGLYLPESRSLPFYLPQRLTDNIFVDTPFVNWKIAEKPEEPPENPEEPFEVNLCEPLIGWRQWTIRDGRLTSYYKAHSWFPMKAFEARCRGSLRGSSSQHDLRINPGIPKEECTCGVYAVDAPELLDTDGTRSPLHVYGKVYGWGRYVRCTGGWRAQYAYPKSFFLHKGQEELIDIL